ncbi:hypothetical protein B0J11DRAFT_580907 [Dendryphion nanum]|uniref:Uncharacterized protein n=1 Tax=Dendryphion nanum TaxID=256645 RepID=A0A9P9DSD6_9PLEO|nr:hypothetical protein B0J11DRAFT_580907 [Dendryphion nanum]
MSSSDNRFATLSNESNVDAEQIEQQQQTVPTADMNSFKTVWDWQADFLPVGSLNITNTQTSASPGKVFPPSPHEIEVVDDLPEGLQFKELAEKDYNPYNFKSCIGDMSLVHREYRSQDAIAFRTIKATETCAAAVVFLDILDSKKQQPVILSHAAARDAPAEEKALVTARVNFLTSTQFTGVRLLLIRRDKQKRDIQYRIYGPAFAKQENGKVGFAMHKYDGTGPDGSPQKTCLFNHPVLTKLATDKNLISTMVLLQSHGSKDRAGAPLRPSFYNIDPSEIQDIIRRYKANEPLQPDECMIACLHESRSFIIFRRIDGSPSADPDTFIKYFEACMWANIFHGPLWFYKLQAPPQTSLMSPDFPLDTVEVPRWIVQSWKLTKEKSSGKIVSYKPSSWKPLSKVIEYPNAESCAFLASLALVREQQNNTESIKSMLSSDTTSIEAIFRSNPGMPGQFLVDLFVPGKSQNIGRWETLKPATETRIKLTVEKNKYKMTFHGKIMDDIFGAQGHGCDIVAGVSGPLTGVPEDRVPVCLELVDDPTVTDRAINSISWLSKGLKRTSGIDLCNVILGAPRAIDESKLNTLKAHLGVDKVNEVEKRLLDIHKLNDEQITAAMAVIRSPFSLVWGPAGTGKTETLKAIVTELARFHVPQIFTCPSNRATDKLMGDCLQANPDLKAIRFIGGFRSSPMKAPSRDTADATGAESATEVLDQTWEMYLEHFNLREAGHPDHLYQSRKEAEIVRWNNHDGHVMKDIAHQYLQSKAELKDAKNKDDKESAIVSKEEADKKLTQYFFANSVDVVFVTCSSACHDILANNFKPRVGFIDEAGQAAIGEVCMAFAPYKESLESCQLAGDHVQLGPVVTSELSNECVKTMEVSLFQQIVQNKDKPHPVHLLDTQYRSHPDIMEFANNNFYGGKLQNHGSTMHETGIHKTLRQFFANLGPAWNKRWRIAIDVSSGSAMSTRYENSNSFSNDAEAELIVRLIIAMIAFDPVDDGEVPKPEKIKPEAEDCAIFTPYTGQARLFIQKIRTAGLQYSRRTIRTPDKLNFVGTTHGLQGGDTPIGFISNVSRDPTDANRKTQFVGNAKNVAVNCTRSRKLDIWTTNIGPIIDVLKQGEKDAKIRAKTHLYKGNMGSFRALNEYFHNNKSIISADDIEAALLSDNPRKLKSSSYYNEHNFSLDTFGKLKPLNSPARPAGNQLGGPNPGSSQRTKQGTKRVASNEAGSSSVVKKPKYS